MDTEQNKTILRNFLQVVWREGNLDALPNYWTKDCVNHAAPEPMRVGLVNLRAYHESFGAMLAAFSNFEITLIQQIAEEDRVASHILATAKHTGNFQGFAATGKSVSFATIRIDRFEDGGIAEHWSTSDTAGLLAQLQTALTATEPRFHP